MGLCNYCNDAVAFPFNCSLCKNKFCGNHRLPESHNCPNLRAYNSDKYRKLKTQKSDLAVGKGKSITYMSDIENDIRQEEIEEGIHDNPDIISFGRERVDLLVGLVLIVFASSFFQFVTGRYNLTDVLLLAFLVGPGFILHELGHKYTAIYFGKAARFLLRKKMALVTLFMGLLPFGIAGPGVATIFDQSNEREMGIFAFAGPLVNLILSFIYIFLFIVFENTLIEYASIFILGAWFNIFLGLFNLIPFGPLDGKKIISWSTPMWIIIVVSLVFQIFISSAVIGA